MWDIIDIKTNLVVIIEGGPGMVVTILPLDAM